MERPHFGVRRVLRVDGQRLVVFEEGAGEPCVLLHGYPQDHWCWHQLAPELARSHRVIAPDWFGWGESERSLADAPTYERETARIGLLLDALGLERVNLVCHDYGGFLGMGFAQDHPDRILRLAIVNSRCQGTFSPFGFVLFNALVLGARLPFGLELYRALPLAWVHRLLMARYVRSGALTSENLDRYLEFLLASEGRAWLGHFFRSFQATRRRALRDGCRTLRFPVAAIWGDRDSYSPITIGEELVRLAPDAELTRIAGADHYVMEERPVEVLAALRRLLARPA